MSSNRLEQLDSVRGLAAFVVFFGHIYSQYPFLPVAISEYTPFKVLINGHSSVIMFFLLSGFVLMLPFLKGQSIGYREFLIKRIFRIYVPYLAAVLLALICSMTIVSGNVEGFDEYFNQFWNYKLDLSLILQHVFFIGNINSYAFDPVIWSLIHEMRISILFPVLAVMAFRLNWKTNIVIGLALSMITAVVHLLGLEKSNGYQVAYTDTLHFTSMFIFGAIIATKMNEIRELYGKITPKLKVILILLAFVLYNYANTSNWIVNDYLCLVGAAAFLIISLNSNKVISFLKQKVFLFFGKISYSLYLFHFIVMLGVIHLLNNVIPVWSIYCIYVTLSIGISFLAWRYIERTSIILGRMVVNRISRRNINDMTNSKVSKPLT